MRRQGNYVYLLISLLVSIFMIAVVAGRLDRIGFIAIELVFVVTLLIGVWSLLGERKWFLVGLFLVLIGVVNTVIMIFLDVLALRFVTIATAFLFFLLTSIIAVHHVLSARSVSLNEIVGAICIYLLMGFIWTLIYLFLNAAVPDSFLGISLASDGTELVGLAYYSFVTLTSLGYGDITPVTPLARTLAYLEAIIGQFYIAVLVATLVGIHVSHRQSSGKNNDTSDPSQ